MKIVEEPDGHFARCQWLVDNADEPIVDIGCNDGFMFRDKSDLNVVFVDRISCIPLSYRGITFVRSDAHHLPFRETTFNTAVLGDILEHVEDPVSVLRETRRIADHVIITTPNEWEWSLDKAPFSEHKPEHIRHYTAETLENDLKAGFKSGYSIFVINGGGWSFFCAEWKTP